MSTSHAPVSHIAPMITATMAKDSEAAVREQRNAPLSPMQRAHIRIYSAILQGVEEYGDNVIKVPFWQLLHAHTLMGGFNVKGGGMRINTEVEWTRRDCPQALRMAFDSALTDQCKLFPLIGSAALRKVPDHLWVAAQTHRSLYGRYNLGAVAVKNGKAHPEDRPILGIVLFDDVGRTMLAEGNLSAAVAGRGISDLIKDLTATHLFSMVPFFIKKQSEEIQFLVTEYYKMSVQLGVLNTTMGFSLGQSWNSFSVEQYVPAPLEPALTAPVAVIEAPVAEPVAEAPAAIVEQPKAPEPVAQVEEAVEDEEEVALEPREIQLGRRAPEMERHVEAIVSNTAPAAVLPQSAPTIPVAPEIDLFAELTPEQEFEQKKNDLMARMKIATLKVATCTRELATCAGTHSIVYLGNLERATKEVNDVKAEAAALKAQYGRKA